MKKPSTIVAGAAAFSSARHHATEAFRFGSAAANHAILCGIELIRLRDQLGTTQGTRNDLKRTSPHAVEKLPWPQLVEREVGISDETARRWMQAARNQLPVLAETLKIEAGPACIEAVAEVLDQPKTLKAVAAITEGKTLEQLMLPLDASGTFDPAGLPTKQRQRFDELQDAALDGDKKAAALIRQIKDGTLPPGRAYAGWKGEKERQAQGKGGRADVNHARNIRAGLKKLETSLPHFHKLDPEEQAVLIRFWRDHKIAKLLPPAWTVA